jgi:hypothetical protein
MRASTPSVRKGKTDAIHYQYGTDEYRERASGRRDGDVETPAHTAFWAVAREGGAAVARYHSAYTLILNICDEQATFTIQEAIVWLS